MKQNSKTQQNQVSQVGFTLVELLVVISIMMLSFAIVLVGLNQQRIKRSVTLAQNETVTNIRKVQSYMLSARNIGQNNKAVKYYILQFTPGANSYSIRAVDSDYTYHSNVETIALKDGVIIDQLIVTDRTGSQLSTSQCAQLIFSAPFSKIYMDTSYCDNSIIPILRNPVEMINKTDATFQISLRNTAGTTVKTITVSGFSNRVIAN